MNNREFKKIMAYLTAAYPDKQVTNGTMTVYWDVLKDLDAGLVQAAVIKTVAEHEYPTLPTAGAIRKAAMDISNPPNISGPEAWALVEKAIQRHGSRRPAQAYAILGPELAQAVRDYGGIEALAMSESPPEVLRAHFGRFWEARQTRTREFSNLPPLVQGIMANAFKRVGRPMPGGGAYLPEPARTVPHYEDDDYDGLNVDGEPVN